ncbi:G-protein coupled receptors family 1 profile domain-containing protein [Caenorhabditis elegans]|uniref:G-protein coupled receptors family 1 profile domain-containing protein n=1 Tax=Caenorhabditis elegans TaxID=6239 RepID=Q7YWV5_CAEEL|nr:G-protein coupled receptors family 1 profile domain-containing protein [Caenorhabditis elegans]CAE17917.2 G-protein coupled receptors family 1 profile domain-containing protein [Caenorhabditis elegans]|eukprot:NP_001024075.1 Serpentine Receptor, class W [Caenorhabditis elegans]
MFEFSYFFSFLSDHEYTVCFFSFIINIVHLLILTRKYMRTASIYVLLIGVCIAELYLMFLPLKQKLEEFLESRMKCPLPSSIFQIYISRIVFSTGDNMSRLSIWLCVLFALVRVIVLQKINDNRFQILSAPGFGWILIFFSFILSGIMSISHYYKDHIEEVGLCIPQPGCESLSVSQIYQYHLVISELYTFGNGIFAKLFFLSNGIFTLILPCSVILIIIVFLIKEIIKSKKKHIERTVNPHHMRNEKTTILVTILSIVEFSFLLSSGLIFIVEIVFGRNTLEIINYANISLRWIFALKSSTRCFLCVLFSCRYRNAIRRMFGFKDAIAVMNQHKPSMAPPSPSLQRSASSNMPPSSPKMESSL